MDLAGGMAARLLILPQTLQGILLIKLAETLPQRREAGREELGRAEEILRQHRKALGRVGCRIGVNAGRAFADQVYFILNVIHRRVQIVLPARHLAKRDQRYSAGAIAVAGIELMRQPR